MTCSLVPFGLRLRSCKCLVLQLYYTKVWNSKGIQVQWTLLKRLLVKIIKIGCWLSSFIGMNAIKHTLFISYILHRLLEIHLSHGLNEVMPLVQTSKSLAYVVIFRNCTLVGLFNIVKVSAATASIGYGQLLPASNPVVRDCTLWVFLNFQADEQGSYCSAIKIYHFAVILCKYM